MKKDFGLTIPLYPRTSQNPNNLSINCLLSKQHVMQWLELIVPLKLHLSRPLIPRPHIFLLTHKKFICPYITIPKAKYLFFHKKNDDIEVWPVTAREFPNGYCLQGPSAVAILSTPAAQNNEAAAGLLSRNDRWTSCTLAAALLFSRPPIAHNLWPISSFHGRWTCKRGPVTSLIENCFETTSIKCNHRGWQHYCIYVFRKWEASSSWPWECSSQGRSCLRSTWSW